MDDIRDFMTLQEEQKTACGAFNSEFTFHEMKTYEILSDGRKFRYSCKLLDLRFKYHSGNACKLQVSA